MFGSDYFNNIIGGNLSDASQIYSSVSERNRLAQAKNTREIVSALKNLEKTLKEKEHSITLAVLCYSILNGNSMGLTREEQNEILDEMIKNYRNSKDSQKTK